MTERTVIQFRVSPEEKALIEQTAAHLGMKTGEMCRKLALGRAQLKTSEYDDPAVHQHVHEDWARAMNDRVESLGLEEEMTAVKLRGRLKGGITLRDAQRHIDKGTWRTLL